MWAAGEWVGGRVGVGWSGWGWLGFLGLLRRRRERERERERERVCVHVRVRVRVRVCDGGEKVEYEPLNLHRSFNLNLKFQPVLPTPHLSNSKQGWLGGVSVGGCIP